MRGRLAKGPVALAGAYTDAALASIFDLGDVSFED